MGTGIQKDINMASKILTEKAKALEPTIRIGKSGITESQVNEIKKQLEKRKLVKIKLLRSFVQKAGRKKAIEEIAEKTNSEIILAVGFTFVLHKRQ